MRQFSYANQTTYAPVRATVRAPVVARQEKRRIMF